jgi:hypothetical protein
VLFKLDEITLFYNIKKATGIQKIYDTVMIKMIEGFVKNLISFKKSKAPKIPEGSPIGSDYNY